MRALIPFLATLFAAGPALCAAPSCAIPATLETPHAEQASPDQPARIVPIDGYTLALIWTPQHCRRAVPGAESFRCTGGRRFGFSLHGLWPDGEGKSWPQWCAPAPILSRATIAAHFCATPSPQLLQHEWAKHGTCMTGYTPDRYFDLSNRLFAALKFPHMAALSRRPLTADQFRHAVADRNPTVPVEAIRLNLDRKGWLQEMWICLDRRFKATACQPAPADGGKPVLIWRGFR